MSHYNGCGCGGGCNSCTSHNEIQQAVNDALAFEKENLEQYENNAAQSATDAAKEAAKAAESASAAAQSQTNAETAAGTATSASKVVTDTAVILEETAEAIKAAQALLDDKVSALQTKPVYFEVTEPTSVLTLPTATIAFNVRSIYVASARQDVGYGFEFDKTAQTITLAEAITAEQIAETNEGYILVTVICDLSSSDDPTSLSILLASNAGASLIGTSSGETVQEVLLNKVDASLLDYVSPEMYVPAGVNPTDYAPYIHACFDAVAAHGVKTIKLLKMYPVAAGSSFTVNTDYTTIQGFPWTGIRMVDAAPADMHNIFLVSASHCTLVGFSIQFNTGGAGSIGSVRTYGVFVNGDTSFNDLDGLQIEGKYSDTTMGFSNGVRLTGTDNIMQRCIVTHCSMGVTVRGTRLTLRNNTLDNGYTTEDGGPWNPSKPQWDGIACEGVIDCLIESNVCKNNGQSGIYIGGGGSGYSSGTLITNNRVYHNWNRGIDTGISGSQSTSNNVTNLIISNNYIRNNRETQLWLYGTNNTQVLGNKIIETAEYDTLFGSQPSTSRAALALGQSAWCVNNIIDDNDIQVRTTTPFGVVFNGLGHIISQNNRIGGGASNYWFGSPVTMLYSNKVAYFKATFTPVLRAGSSGVTLTSGTASYTIRNNEVEYDIELLMNASTGSGNLYVGTLPATNGVLLDSQEVIVTYWTGLTWALIPGSQLQAYFLIDDPAQIAIVRKYGSDTLNDVPSCIGVGTRLRIKARAVINTTTKTNSATGISFFGHSFLSEQGFANGVAESLGKRCYNFARGGSSSSETARVFGAVVGNYMPVGGTIPASGSVDLTPNEDAVWYAGSSLATVVLAGVQGIISSTTVSGTTTKLTFTRSTAGAAVSVPSAVPMTVLPYVRQNSWSTKSLTEHSTFKDDIVVIQCMRNNSSWAQGLTDVAAIVSSLGTNKFVILPEFPYATETTGTAGATTVSNYNAQLKAAYPNNYCQINGVDLLDNFKNNYNPDYAQDVTDIANGVTPSSLRYDTLHPSRYRQANALRSGVQVNAEFVAKFIKSKGW